ncbi:hypothetical protein ISCGN_001741 [Ixodes scapularis]
MITTLWELVELTKRLKGCLNRTLQNARLRQIVKIEAGASVSIFTICCSCVFCSVLFGHPCNFCSFGLRSSIPQSIQANKLLLLKAMKRARQSVSATAAARTRHNSSLGKASRLVGAIATEVRPREEAAPVALPEAGKLAGTRRGAHEWSCSIPSGVFNSARLI